ncbi:hypothetical protein NDU88_001091 [Pleurodeles waltl]|uniref:Uncharacterized protein n=1 Tax=Pleurodeles waltl TaxID=8319 RepID=A0AAV7U949_PLEWA|nr:hypothetical protein NDU88_001091 [Pleurodeles waltl]
MVQVFDSPFSSAALVEREQDVNPVCPCVQLRFQLRVIYFPSDRARSEHPDVNEEYAMEERLAEALGSHVQESVNQALIKALKPFTRPLFIYGQRELGGGLPMVNMSSDDLAPDVGFAQRASVGPSLSADILVQMAASVIKDHEYDLFPSLEATGSLPRMSSNTLDAAKSDSSHSSKSERTDDPKPTGKR